MKRSLFFLLLSVFSLPGFAQQGKKVFVNKGGDNGCLITAGNGINPGDTIVVRASLNPWSYVFCGGLAGTAARPIVIINEGSVEMTAGFDLESCLYVKLTGTGPTVGNPATRNERYGFSIRKSSGVAVSIHGKSAHMEAEKFFAGNCAYGCWIKNEADCDTSVNAWVLDDIRVHDFEMRDISIEGFYAGTTDANNASRPKDCKGVAYFYKPSKLGNIRIYNGVIDGTGRPAIMVSNAQVGMSEIYNNVISNVGREFNDQQGTGISLGLYTRAYVHHNKIRNTYTWGIASLGGSGLVRIEHNQVDRSGFLDGRTLDWPQNIVIDTRPTAPADSTRFIISNNEVGNPGRQASEIEIWKSFDTYSKDNTICNNTSAGKPASVKVTPGISWWSCGVFQPNAPTSNSSFLLLIAGGALLLVMIIFLALRRRRSLASRSTRSFA